MLLFAEDACDNFDTMIKMKLPDIQKKNFSYASIIIMVFFHNDYFEKCYYFQSESSAGSVELLNRSYFILKWQKMLRPRNPRKRMQKIREPLRLYPRSRRAARLQVNFSSVYFTFISLQNVQGVLSIFRIKLLSVPKFIANLNCICLSIHLRYT